jgi:hypothetical protein
MLMHACNLLFTLQVQSIIARHQPSFAAAGANLLLQRAQQSYWLQIDVAPGPVVGHPGEQFLLCGRASSSARRLLPVLMSVSTSTQMIVQLEHYATMYARLCISADCGNSSVSNADLLLSCLCAVFPPPVDAAASKPGFQQY